MALLPKEKQKYIPCTVNNHQFSLKILMFRAANFSYPESEHF